MSTNTIQHHPDEPTYPNVSVQLSGGDGNVFTVIGRVAAALRAEVGHDAADAFSKAAFDCGSYDEVLQLVMATVDVH